MTLTMRTHKLLPIGLFCLALAACSSSDNNDKVRIGSGQLGTSATTAADFPIFYVKRATPIFTTMTAGVTVADDSIRHQLICNKNKLCTSNADLYMRDRASASANEHNITARVRAMPTDVWDVKDVDVSADAKRVIFAMRGPLKANQKAKAPPTWGIWEYVIATDDLHRVISDDVSAAGGHDVSPHYLPDGHIIFSSTRQRDSKAILLDEGKPQFEAQDENRHEWAFVLHIMDFDGTNIQQLTFNQDHDLNPTVLSDGRILFSRWDHAPGRDGIHLYTSNPDGTDTQLLYGSASHNTVADIDPTAANLVTYPDVEFTQAREMQNGNILTLVRPNSGTEYGGDLYIVDTKNYVENTQATAANAGMMGPAQLSPWPNSVRMITAPSDGGRFVSAAPLWDGTGRILVAWTQCRVLDPTDGVSIIPCSGQLTNPAIKAAPPIYSIWMFDPNAKTVQPIVIPVEGVMMSDVAIAQPRPVPTFLPYSVNGNPNTDLVLMGQGVGILDIRSVYDFDGTVGGGITNIAAVATPGNAAYNTRAARFLRIEKAVSLPDKDVRDVDFGTAFGVTGFMREILGYIPIEPDGSVRAKIPANVAFQISVTDANGRNLTVFPRHNAWISLRPGETLKCNGCHTPAMAPAVMSGQSGISHGRSGLFAQAPGATGAASVATAFPSANPTFVSVNIGDTMAEARAAWSCANEQCASITPSVNLIFADVWPATTTDSHVISAPAAPAVPRVDPPTIQYTGANGVVKLPTSSTCTGVWSNTCRITINYPDHIQPIWDAPINFDANKDGMIDTMDTCTSCHNHTDAPTQQDLDARQLDLTNSPSDNNPVQFMSYQELLSGDLELTTDANGVLILRQVQTGVDPVSMLPIFATVPLNGTRLNARNAIGSRFFSVFSNNQCQHTNGTVGACSVVHATGGVSWLTPGELKLISEWVDIGAQYYNDPFKAPVN